MVKQIKGALAILMASALVLVGCSNLLGGTVSGTGSAGTNSITVTLSDVDTSRSLAPSSLTAASTEISYYSITGESLDGYSFAYAATATSETPAIALGDNKIPQSTFASGGAGSVTLKDVKVDDWTFTMYAHDSSGNVLLKGTSVCNLKSANTTSVAFTLSSFDLTATGGYAITIKYTGSNWVDSYTLTYGLYSTIDGTVKYGTTDVAAANAVNVNIAGGKTGYEIASASVVPGSYLLGVAIKSGSTQLAYASDILIIEPGRTTTANFTIGEIIDSAPAAPTGLAAQWVVGSQDEDFYNVRLYWTDASTNETQFKLLVKEFTDTSSTSWAALSASAAAEFATNATDGTYALDYATLLTLDGSSATSSTYPFRYVAGSLYAGSTELVLKFPTGRLFDVQLYAINSIGNSAACVRAADTSSSASTSYSNTTTAATATATTISTYGSKKVTGYSITSSVNSVDTIDHISLVRISYNLEGGTLKTSAADTFTGSTYVTYTPYKLNTAATGDGSDAYKYIPLMTINASSGTTYPQLVKSNTDCSAWIADIERVATAVTYNTNAYKNITVSAQYGETTKDVTVTGITVDSLPTLAASKITLKYGVNVSTVNDTAIPDDGITISRGGSAMYVTVSIEQPGTGDTSFAKYKLYLNGNYMEEITASSSATVYFTNFSTSKLTNGVENEIMVVGVTSTGKSASAKVTLKLHN